MIKSRSTAALLAAITGAPAGMAGRLFRDVQELAAGLLAHPAVLMVVGMPLALVAVALAAGHAGLQQ
jgi:hypothetical protein